MQEHQGQQKITPTPYAPIPVQDHPSQPYSPFPPLAVPPPMVAAPPKKSSRTLFLALAVGFVVAVAGSIVFAILQSDDDKPSRSRDAVIKQTFAALAAGDENAIYKLTDPKRAFDKIARCEKRSKDDDDKLGIEFTPEKLEERWRKEIRQLLRRTKGAKLQVVDILTENPPPIGTKPKKSSKHDDDDDDKKDRDRDRYRDDDDDDEDRPERDSEYKTTTFKKGQEIFRGCYAKTTFRNQQVKVVVDIKEGDREFSQRVKLTLQELDGQWYLSTPPNLNVGLDVIVADVEAWRDKTCKCTDATCIEDLDEEHGRLAYVQYGLDRDSDLPRETMRRIEKIQDERKVCEGTARGGVELVRYKAAKEQLCACKDEECGRKAELEMTGLRTKVEANAHRGKYPSYEVTRQVSDLAMAAGECTRKLALLRVRAYSVWPTSGDLAGGTFVTIRGSNFLATTRTAKVWFGTKEATTVRIASDTELAAGVPAQDAEGFVDVRVQFEPGGTSTVPYGFTYRAPLKTRSKSKRPTTF